MISIVAVSGAVFALPALLIGSSQATEDVALSLAPPTCDYGSISPNAPEELSQFSFLIGDFTIRARPWTKDGWGAEVDSFRARLTGRYVMGGKVIQDDWFDTDPGLKPDTNGGLTTRMFDTASGEWKIAWMNLSKTQITDLRASMVDGRLTMRTVYPEAPNYDAYFEQNGPDRWTRTAIRTAEDGTQTPIWQAVATRIPCDTDN